MDELVKRLREEARPWCAICCYSAGNRICTAPDERKKDCDIASKLQAADAIEELTAIREEQKAQIIIMAAEIEEQQPR